MGSDYIIKSTKIGKKASDEFKLEYKPIVLQKCISIIRKKHCKATDSSESLKEAEKWIFSNKDAFVKLFNEQLKAMEKKKKK